jgi:hypothetical protein
MTFLKHKLHHSSVQLPSESPTCLQNRISTLFTAYSASPEVNAASLLSSLLSPSFPHCALARQTFHCSSQMASSLWLTSGPLHSWPLLPGKLFKPPSGAPPCLSALGSTWPPQKTHSPYKMHSTPSPDLTAFSSPLPQLPVVCLLPTSPDDHSPLG